MRDIRISLNHDTLEYEVDEVRGGHLRTYASTEKNHDAVLYAKMEIKKNPTKGDRIINSCGTIYTWTGKGWRTDKPSNC